MKNYYNQNNLFSPAIDRNDLNNYLNFLKMYFSLNHKVTFVDCNVVDNVCYLDFGNENKVFHQEIFIK